MYINKLTGVVSSSVSITNISLPKDISPATLEELGYAKIILTVRPDYKVGRVITEAVVEAAGSYTQQWIIDDSLVDDASVLRHERDLMLSQSDYTQATDTTQTVTDKEAWAVYRQELRDLPATYASNPEEVVWPTSPSVILDAPAKP
jgi:hypothetical protein